MFMFISLITTRSSNPKLDITISWLSVFAWLSTVSDIWSCCIEVSLLNPCDYGEKNLASVNEIAAEKSQHFKKVQNYLLRFYFNHLLCSSLFRGFMHSWRFRLGKHTMVTHGKIFQLSKLVGIHLLYKKRFMFNWVVVVVVVLSTQHKARPNISAVLMALILYRKRLTNAACFVLFGLKKGKITALLAAKADRTWNQTSTEKWERKVSWGYQHYCQNYCQCLHRCLECSRHVLKVCSAIMLYDDLSSVILTPAHLAFTCKISHFDYTWKKKKRLAFFKNISDIQKGVTDRHFLSMFQHPMYPATSPTLKTASQSIRISDFEKLCLKNPTSSCLWPRAIRVNVKTPPSFSMNNLRLIKSGFVEYPLSVFLF